jgi:hypothetical protein
MSKRLTVDIGGDKIPAQVVDLASSWPLHVPARGFECVKGAQVISTKARATADSEPGLLLRPGSFLVPIAGRQKEVSVPEDLYLEFADLKRDDIIDFANRFGTLRVSGEHFHREPGMQPCIGEPIEVWIRETDRFKAAINLWYEAKNGTRQTVRRLLSSILDPNVGTELRPPTRFFDDPMEHAREIVINTINRGMSPNQMPDRPCALPECNSEAMHWIDATRAWLRTHKGADPDLVIISTNLIKTLWTQFASLVAGKRKLKRCEADDCRLGGYMDVTDSERPGARRMHPTCAERLKKREYRRRAEL